MHSGLITALPKTAGFRARWLALIIFYLSGDGQVVHLVGEGGSCSISSASASGNARAQFKRDSFWDAVNSSVAQRNNFLDYSHR